MAAGAFDVYLLALLVGAAICIARPPKIALIRGRRHNAVLAAIAVVSLALAVPVFFMARGALGVRFAIALTPCLIALILAAAYLFIRFDTRQQNARQAVRRQQALWQSEGRSAVNQIHVELQAAYPYVLRSPSVEEESLMCMAADGSALRFLRIASVGGRAQRLADVTVPIGDIVSVDLTKHEQVLTQSTTQTRKKGAIGRAVVGDVLFGPTGAVVGAISAGSKSTTTGVEQRIYKYSELVFGLSDLTNPVIRFFHTDHAEADRWLHRIRSAMHRHGAGASAVHPAAAATAALG